MRLLPLAALALATVAAPLSAQQPERPFGTLREQATRQQQWLDARLTTVLPALMRQHGVQMWVVPMREYNEDPVFSSLVSPTTFAARRRTIYVFFDRGGSKGIERLALGGSSQGGLYEAVRSQIKVTSGNVGTGNTAELWGDQQWAVLRQVLEERNPKAIHIDKSRVFAFADGLSAGEYEGMAEQLGPKWAKRFVQNDALAINLIATRLPDEEAFYEQLNKLTWQVIREMFSGAQIVPGVTRTSDLVWFFRQRVNDLGLGTWFQPSVEVQRQGMSAAQLGDDPVIQRGDLLHCDVGITSLRLNTDTQHMAYVLREGETTAPAGLTAALRVANRTQDILMSEIRPARTGNEVLQATKMRMTAEQIDGTIYSHPIGMHGHGAGALIGLWDYQNGVPGRGDHAIVARMWYSIELQATARVAEWGGQPLRMALEEDMMIGADGVPRWAYQQQRELILVQP